MAISASFSECGPIRRINADAWLTDDVHQFYAIADGIGSKPESSKASKLAVAEAHRAFLEGRDRLPIPGPVAIIELAADRYRDHFSGAPIVPGTTLTVLFIHQGALHYASVGDSPAFLLRDGSASLLTKHHTAIDQALVINDYSALKSQSGSNILNNTVGRFPPRPVA